MKRMTSLLLALCLSLCAGCAAREPDDTVMLCFAAELADGTNAALVDKEVLREESGPEALVEQLLRETPPTGTVNLLAGCTLKGCVLREDGVLEVNLSEEYGALTDLDLSLADACIARTVLGALPEVTGVRILCQGLPPVGRGDQVYTAELLDLDLMDLQPVDREITVWFPEEELRFLQPERRSVIIRENEEIQRYILDELTAGARDDGHTDLLSDLPELVLSVSRDRELCYVNLGSASAQQFHGDFRLEAMTLYSIVQSLCAEDEIDAVQFLVDGAPAERFCCVPIREPIVGDAAVTGAPEPAAGQTVVDLYYPGPEELGLVQLPWVVSYREGVSTEQLTLEALLTAPVPFWSGLSLPRSGGISGFRIQSGICYVEFSQEFYYNHLGTQEGEQMLVESIVATLLEFDAIDKVQFSVQGLIDASFQHYSLDAPLDGRGIRYYTFDK